MILLQGGRQSTGTRIADLVAVGQAVFLCEPCWRKDTQWLSRRYYRGKWDCRFDVAECDGCGRHAPKGLAFFPEEELFKAMRTSGEEHTLRNRKQTYAI